MGLVVKFILEGVWNLSHKTHYHLVLRGAIMLHFQHLEKEIDFFLTPRNGTSSARNLRPNIPHYCQKKVASETILTTRSTSVVRKSALSQNPLSPTIHSYTFLKSDSTFRPMQMLQ